MTAMEWGAIALWCQKNGFVRLDRPLGKTGHFACDVIYIKDL